ncbi:hypothetical protein H312_00533 [Anncaliia algerae PRA339]|uniref:Uncharacterized protein n=1 Tax=Anncaliia algerae PRA339 TaxID=1288291 RepID=A0A059F546_9MICR|nr:hypothetical protein H312_00533 [Anncaliia algerae PRA339]
MFSDKEIEEKKQEIKSLGLLRKVPVVLTYAVDKHIINKVPPKAKETIEKIKSIAFASITIFSVTVLPILYVYNRDREEDKESPLMLNK